MCNLIRLFSTIEEPVVNWPDIKNHLRLSGRVPGYKSDFVQNKFFFLFDVVDHCAQLVKGLLLVPAHATDEHDLSGNL